MQKPDLAFIDNGYQLPDGSYNYYSMDEIYNMLELVKDAGLNVGKGSELEGITIRQLDVLTMHPERGD